MLWAQPATFALECALTALWESVGVRPAVAAGEGVGELAAAWGAGVFSLEDGLRLAGARGMAMARPIARVAAAMPVGHASGAGEDPLADLEAAFDAVDASPPSISLLSQVTGEAVSPARLSGGAYWREQVRARVPRERWSAACADLQVKLVMEIDPQRTPAPTELSTGLAGLASANHTFVESVAAAYQAGLPVTFEGLFAGEVRRRISLPGYPFQRERYWIETGP